MDLPTITQELLNRGIAQAGFACVKTAVPDACSSLPYAISLICKLAGGILNPVANEPTYAYFHHYCTVNAFLDSQALWLSAMLEREGSLAAPIAASQSVHDQADPYTGLFQHKTAAVPAGLGWIGKSALFVSPVYGPRVRLGTVLANMPQLYRRLPAGSPA